MDKASGIRAAVCGGIGAIGGFLSSLFGGWTNDLTTLIIFMAGSLRRPWGTPRRPRTAGFPALLAGWGWRRSA